VVIAVVVVGSVYLITNHHSSPKAAIKETPQAKLDAIAVKAGCPPSPKTRANNFSYKSAPPLTISTTATYDATVKTDVGTFVISLDPKEAPQTVNSFVFLTNKDYYDCVIFHRVIPGFVDQTGDPTGTGAGGPGYTIPDEYPPKAANPADQYPIGSVAMANTGQPHSGGSQWFVVTGANGASLSNTYTLFGTVTSGMNVIQKINKDGTSGGTPKLYHRILSIKVKEA
jgi:cyclophilin family peptidyl-prolyl cis-trans isomerase